MLHAYENHNPRFGPGVFVAPSADIIGRVTLGRDASVFFQCVLRGDINAIDVGARSNIQDQTTIHVASNMAAWIGDDVSVGHACILHACTVGDRVLVGMGSIIMDGAVVGEDSIVGAGSLLPKDKAYPPGSLILGSPARVLRPLTSEEKNGIAALAKKYVGVKDAYLQSPGTSSPPC
jgi:carbonic anhydrase/acetyltransferase-like protein (isoleucine patch superfamily)